MTSSAAKMNAVPESGPVKTVQLQGKIIAITGANRGTSSHFLPPLTTNMPQESALVLQTAVSPMEPQRSTPLTSATQGMISPPFQRNTQARSLQFKQM